MRPANFRPLAMLAVVTFSLASQGAEPTHEQTRAIAKDAYIYGVPMVSVYGTVHAFSIDKGNPQYKGPFNSVLNVARVFTPADTAFVTPNSDTPYTFIGLDLRAEPQVISVPKMEKDRYFVFQLMDLFTFNFAYIGSRTTGNDGGHYLIAGPGWKGEKPAGITQVIHSETSLVNVIGRTQLFNPADLDTVKKIQAGYQVQPLSKFLNKPAAKPAADVAWLPALAPKEARTSAQFFNELAFLLQFAEPAHPSEVALRKRFASLGIEPGKPFNLSQRSPDQLKALQEGMADGQKAIDDYRASLGGKVDSLFGDRAFLANNYLRRATGTQVGIGANSREEALYPIYEKDANGQPLDGGKHRYTLRFANGKLPPVNAFWSLTMYDLPSQLLVKNPLNRYLINSPMLPDLKSDADGGLTLYIQADSPGQDLEANWLPAPKGPFMLTMRYYWPKAELLENRWQSPVVEVAK
ncbi:MAG: DUF1254 domain-containing protein [Pseudomonas sp.]|uniref:DUF1254 domain-containing protein n=1 Tax=Pseudomonas sp. TaxID=306 RepID=UPI0030F2D5A4